MYRRIEDFIADWNESSAGTLKAIRALEDDKLNQAIVVGHSTLGWLSWHLVGAMSFFGASAGLLVPIQGRPDEQPTTVEELAQGYEKNAAEIVEGATKFTDADLEKYVDAFGQRQQIGKLLRKMIDHQTHHRGQMTVLIRQAGLIVPPIMGPTQEMSRK
ncbi:MAG: DinB family protein [Kurthia sp.]|nr:DinB family protein [Candidatus Kurthia equi]